MILYALLCGSVSIKFENLLFEFSNSLCFVMAEILSLVSPPLILVCFSLFSFHSMMSTYQLFLRKLKVGSSTLDLFLFSPLVQDVCSY